MKKPTAGGGVSQNHVTRLTRGLSVVCGLFFFTAPALHAQAPNPSGWTNTDYYGSPIAAWSFTDTTNWHSDPGYAPVSYTNITSSLLGDGTAVVVDSTVPAWLRYNVTETSGTNNLKVDRGSVILWFAPHWSGTNEGGTGPGTWGRLLEVGSINSNGWWSLYIDPEGVNVYFGAQTNGGPPVAYLSAPINWTTNYWHEIALTYTATNSRLYLDGWFSTDGPGITNFPGLDVLTNGFFIGSDRTGNNQAHGMFDDIYTYNYPISYNTVSVEYMTGMMYLLLNRLNAANFVPSGPSSPSTTIYNIIAGPGFLTSLGASGSCVTNSDVRMMNMTATTTSQPMTFNFAIAGGTNGLMYDVFVSPVLTPQLTNGLWSWMGQGGTCTNYSIPNLPTTGAAFFILGTPVDSDLDGLTDAYELLVSHTNPNLADTDGDGIPDGWAVYLGLNPTGNDSNNSSSRANFDYTLADWLEGVSGVKGGLVTSDNEGNVTAVSQ